MPTEDPDLLQITATLRAAGCVYAEDEAQLLVAAAQTPADLAAMLQQRVAGLPLEQILGWAEFCGLQIAVEAGVFVPRRRTQLMVTQAVDLLAATAAIPRPVVVDLCCGTGAVGAAIAAAWEGVDLYAADIDPAAVQCARRNLPGAHVYEGDLFDPLPLSLRGQVTILAANAPYVPTESIALMPPEARLHEPQVALDGGDDGLDIQRRVIAAAPLWLAPGGHVLIETGEAQAPHTLAAVTAAGLTGHVMTSADLDATVVIGTMSGQR